MPSADHRDPFISVVVPVRNAERTLDKTLDYLEALDYPRERMEIVLADGGSTDRTVEIVRRRQASLRHLRLVEVPNCTSPGHARNAALKVAQGEFILFTDGDCAPNPDWVREILRPFFQDERIGGVGGEVLTLRTDPENATEAYCEQVRFLSVSGRCGVTESGYFPTLAEGAPHEVNGGDHSPFFATANAAFRRAAIAAIGGEFWSEPTGEDVDFCLRILKRGYRLYFAREAVVRHMHRVSLESYLRQWRGYGFGHPLLVSKHAADRLEVVLQLPEPVFINIPSPQKGIVHVGAFHLMHLFLGGALVAGAAAALTTAALPWLGAGLALSAGSALAYFWPCLKLRPASKLLTWCKIRYLTNWAFIRGALAGTRRFGALCVEPSW
ncbi:MAG: glycosyltransferase [Chloroflexi bacterium]|nr:glycosyltransferase [Chloroflexota bacterium]